MRVSSRAIAIAALTMAALAGRVAVAQTPAVTVTIDGTPVTFDQPPVEQAGRVYVPLRGVFERLGASVVYDRGKINATKGATTVSLSVGSTAALVNGQDQHLDNPPIVVGQRMLVPLRFVSQALGTTVNFIKDTQTVAITLPARPSLPRRTLTTAAAALPATGMLVQLAPAPDALVAPRVKAIAAHFSQAVDPKTVHATLDGIDISAGIYAGANDFSYSVAIPLKAGRHTIVISGNLAGGAPFSSGWSFSTAYDQFVFLPARLG